MQYADPTVTPAAAALYAAGIKLSAPELRWLAHQFKLAAAGRNCLALPPIHPDGESGVVQASFLPVVASLDAQFPVSSSPGPLTKVGGTTSARAMVAAEREAGVKVVIDAYHVLFVERHGEKPNLGGRDAAIMKTLIGRHGAEKVLDVLARMFDSTDPWVAQEHSIGALSSKWNRIVSSSARLGSRTSGNLEAAKQALENMRARRQVARP